MTHESEWLAARFEEHRGRLTAVARRMLGSASEAEDAVQETWIRLSRADAETIENLGGWLTTVASRVCLNMLQSRRARLEVPLEPNGLEPAANEATVPDPEYEALLADSVGLALIVVLDTLSPAERVAFVLHDMFGIPFEEIAPIVGRTPPAARQLASRARRRVRREEATSEATRVRQAEVVDAFLAAARGGDFERLVALLDPDVVMRADAAAVRLGAEPETRGATEVAGFLRIARGATPVLVNSEPAVAWIPGGELRVVHRFTVRDGLISAVELIAEPERLRELDVVPFD